MVKPLLLAGSIVAAVLCVFLSEVSSPRYLALVCSALAFAAIHFIAGVLFLRRASSRAKWLLVVLTLPVFAFAVDDLGRLLSILKMPSFRLFV